MRRGFYVLINCFICLLVTSCSSNSKYVVKESPSQSSEDPISAYNLALGYFNEQNYTQAVYWYTKAAEQGDAGAIKGTRG
jgi:hypothetical protein